MSEKTLAELKALKFPRAGCPRCLYHDTFNKVATHMFRKNHLYEGHGTYPMHIPDLPMLMAMGYESLKECANCRENMIKKRYGGYWLGFQGALPFCQTCKYLVIAEETQPQ